MTMYSVFVGIPRNISRVGQSWIVNRLRACSVDWKLPLLRNASERLNCTAELGRRELSRIFHILRMMKASLAVMHRTYHTELLNQVVGVVHKGLSPEGDLTLQELQEI